MSACGGNCRQKTGAVCCLSCHFDFEEEQVAPYLPGHVRTQLRSEHAALRAAGFPHDAVAAHGAREEAIFRRHGVPGFVMAAIYADHDKHARGELPIED